MRLWLPFKPSPRSFPSSRLHGWTCKLLLEMLEVWHTNFMLKLRDSAPRFDCRAVVECEMVHLKWTELHRNQNLGLLFDSIFCSIRSSVRFD